MNERTVFWKKLTPLVLPIAFQQLMLSLVSASDAIMLGMVDQSSMSAVSLATQIQFIFGMFMAGFTGGGSILAAQYWGKGSRSDVEQVLAIMLHPGLAMGTLFTSATTLVPNLMMRIFTTDEILISLGANYLRAVSLSYLLYAISSSYMCIMRNSGRTQVASVIIGAGVLMNIVLNAILIFGLLGTPELGVQGAAIATVITRGFEFACVLIEMHRPNRLKLQKEYFFGTHLPLLHDYIKHTSPVTCNFLVWGVGVSMGSVILGHLGNDAVAANSIASVVKNLIFCFCMGVGNGGAILVGNELGAGNLEGAKEYGGKVVRLALTCGTLSCATLIMLTPFILRIAELSPLAEEYLQGMIVVCGINMIGAANNTAIVSGLFNAGGDTKFGVICDTITLWGIVVPLGFLAAFVFEWPILMVYCIICMDEIIKLPVVWKHYRKYTWVNNLTK